MYNYLATIRHNDGTTGELVDLKRATFESETPLTERDREQICEYMQDMTEYEPDDGDVFRIDIVELADEPEDEPQDEPQDDIYEDVYNSFKHINDLLRKRRGRD